MVRDGLPAIVIAIAAAPPAAACCTQEERWHLDANLIDEVIGTGLAWVGDLDGDGIDDFAAGVVIYGNEQDRENPFEEDRVDLRSGRDGALLRQLRGGWATQFGIELSACGDQDGDGFDDLIVAQQWDDAGKGRATVWSSATGALLAVVATPGIDDWSGASLDSLPDSDGDGRQEFVVGLPMADFGGGRVGVVQVRSSRDGGLLAEWRGAQAHGLGAAPTFGVVDDLDLDGADDLVVVDWTLLSDGRHQFDVIGISGATLAQRFRSITISTTGVPGGICSADDYDLDGYDDFAFVRNYMQTTSTRHELRIHSGKNGVGLRAVNALSGDVADVAATGDLDGDGHPDVAISLVDESTDEMQLVVRSTKQPGMPVIDEVVAPFPDFDWGQRFRLPRGRPCDVDGDGSTDLLHSFIPTWSFVYLASRVAIRSPAADVDLVSVASDEETIGFVNAIVTGDLDGDGIGDLVLHEFDGYSGLDPGDLVARSGADGRKLHRVANVAGFSAHSLVALPDLDRDDVPDYAAISASGRIAVRSGRDGALLATYGAVLSFRSNSSLAVIVDTEHRGAARRHRLAIGSPASNGPELTVLDPATGALLWSIDQGVSHFARNVVVLGDVDGDGVGDLACDEPHASSAGFGVGRLLVLSGADGSVLAERRAAPGEQLGGALAVAEDHDGDGVAELLVGSPVSGRAGSMSLHRGVDLHELARWTSALSPNAAFGDQVLAFPDSNGDGGQELLALADLGEWTECFSASSYRFLAPILPVRRSWNTRAIRVAAPWIPTDPDAQRTLVTLNIPADGLYVWTLPPLHLTLTPASVAPDETITADVRGGPERSPMVLRLVAIDGVALDVVLVADALDRYGEWTISDTAPPGLSGTTLAFRAATIGFDGRLAQSSIRELLFE